MASDAVQQLQAYLQPLLGSLDGLIQLTRHLDPIGYSHQLARAGEVHRDLRVVRGTTEWAPPYSALRPVLDETADLVIAAYDGLIEASAPPEDMMLAFKALRHLPRALETLYPLAGIVPPINRFYLDPGAREDMELQKRLFRQPPPERTGAIRIGEDPGARETFWMYVPETYDPATPAPVVFALHGGSGSGRSFLWSWVRAARTRGAIVVAPTALGQTWAIQGDDPDSPRLARLLAFVRETWSVDPERMLLTGLSDGGTFTYTSGLLAESPFTHLAPVAAAFHPMLAAMADGERMQGLPIHIMHGERDWMFPVAMAREAHQHLSSAGANVTYRRLDDLSHAYGPDLSSIILDWLLA
jgi:phospholipase/carboxylesterase